MRGHVEAMQQPAHWAGQQIDGETMDNDVSPYPSGRL